MFITSHIYESHLRVTLGLSARFNIVYYQSEGGDPERIIEVPGCVGLDGVGYDRSVGVQTPGNLDLCCMYARHNCTGIWGGDCVGARFLECCS